ncbi:MAG: tripartite tricarboxylate transporter TctB family protein [Lawsonibacter sp.]
MKNKHYKLDIIPGAVIALFSVLYLMKVPSIPTFVGLGSTPLTNHFVPYLWGGFLLFLGLWIVVRGLKKRRRYLAEGGVVQKGSVKQAISEKREVIASFLVLGLYVGLMGTLGFVISTILYVFAQVIILTPRENWKKTYVPAGIVAVVTGTLLYYIFKFLLNVLLPSGILRGIGL